MSFVILTKMEQWLITMRSKNLTVAMLSMFLSTPVFAGQEAIFTPSAVLLKSAEVAQASQQKLTALQSYIASPEAAADRQNALRQAADSPLQQGVHDTKSSVKQLFNRVTGDSKAVVEQEKADEMYHLVNPSESH
jgi:hypothetical protein